MSLCCALARPDSAVMTVIGAGTQARTQIEALAHVLPIRRVHLVGRDRDRSIAQAAAFEATLSLEVEASTKKRLVLEVVR